MFGIIQKRSSNGWQATCPFHRGSVTAPLCRKFIPATGPGEGEMAVAKAMAKEWCLHYDRYDRKHKHLNWVPPAVPRADAVLELQMYLVNPPSEEPIPDAVLDGLAKHVPKVKGMHPMRESGGKRKRKSKCQGHACTQLTMGEKGEGKRKENSQGEGQEEGWRTGGRGQVWGRIWSSIKFWSGCAANFVALVTW